MNFKEIVRNHIKNDDSFLKLERYVELIEEKNKVMNLTGFSGDKLWQEGIYESIISLESFIEDNHKEILDIGAGAGFPSIPYAIAYPDKHITIIEPLQKRMLFLDEVVKELNLNVTLVVGRAEESNLKNTFDAITARAVAPLKVLIEISYKLGKIGCVFGWVKGPKIQEETIEAKNIISKFGIVVKNHKIMLENTDKEIYISEYKKEKEIPNGYPRNWAQIAK